MTGEGLPELLARIEEAFDEQLVSLELLLPYQRGDLLGQIHQRGVIDREEHELTGTRLSVRVPGDLAPRLEPYKASSATTTASGDGCLTQTWFQPRRVELGRRRRNGDPGVGAFFDMDNTVLRDSSGRLYLQYLRRKGLLSWPRWLAITWQVGLYVMGLTSFPQLMARLMTQVAGADEAEAWRISAAWFDEMLRDYIAPAARAAHHLASPTGASRGDRLGFHAVRCLPGGA